MANPSIEVNQSGVDFTGNRSISNTTVSTSIRIFIGNDRIGYISRLTESQTRDASAVYEIGTVGAVDIIPHQPGLITLEAEKTAVYKHNLVNVLAGTALRANNTGALTTPPGMGAGDKSSIVSTVNSFLNNKDSSKNIFVLADIPIGFDIEVREYYPLDPESSYSVTKYKNCWITRYSRPIVTAGALTIVETASISALDVDYVVV